MRDALSRLVIALGLVPALLLGAGSPASADDRSSCTTARGQAACTVLRAPAIRGPRPEPALGAGQCIVLVGGLDSPTDHDDAFFRPIVAPLQEDGGYEVVRFGLDPGTIGHEYDTHGAISRNGGELRGLVCDLSGRCGAIHVLSHSMGGAVADRAFSMGDLASDGVVTYVALSGPHNGATGARAVRRGVEASATFASGVHTVTTAVHEHDPDGRIPLHDPTSDAVRDLARIHAPRPVRDVEAVRLRLVNDEIVLRRDNVDRRIDVREYLPQGGDQWEGHGGIVANTTVERVVSGAIRTHHVPADDRSREELARTADESVKWERLLTGAHEGIGLALLAAAIATEGVSGLASTLRSLGSNVLADAAAIASAVARVTSAVSDADRFYRR